MGDEFDTSVDTSSFDDTSFDFSDTSSFDTSTDVGEIMDDSSFEVADTIDESDFSDYDVSGDTSEVDDLMSDTSDEYIETLDTYDLDSDVTDNETEDIESLMDDTIVDEFSELSDTPEETDLDVESDIVDLMDETTLETTDETTDMPSEEVAETDEISELIDEGVGDSIDETVESLEDTDVVEDSTEDTADDIESLMDDSGEEVADITEETGDTTAEVEEETSDVSDLMDEADMQTVDIADEVATDIDDNDSSNDIVDTIEDDVGEVVSDLPEADTSDERTYLTQDEFDSILGSLDRDALERLRQGVESGNIQVYSETSDTSDDTGEGPVLTRDVNEQWELGNNAIENNVEAMRDDLRDKGLEDGPRMEAIVMRERARMQEELQRNIDGDFSDPYVKPNFDEILANGELFAETLEVDSPLDIEALVVDTPTEIDYDAVYGGLDEYDFDGIDFSVDTERLDASLGNFESDTWEQLSIDEQKNAMSDLADYVEEVIGFDNPPEIVYYNNPVEGDYGGYSPSTNTLEVNEYMLYNNEEAADTVAHELWHAYQHQCALNPQSAKDHQYQYGFDNYIRPEDDFTGYQDQLVEAEARAFAQQFKDRLNTKGRQI